MKEDMDASNQIDDSVQGLIASRIKAMEINYDKSYNEKFVDVDGMQQVRGAFPLSQTYLKTEGNGSGWGKTTLIVNANMEDIAAFFWDFESRCHLATTGDIDRKIDQKIEEWEMIVRRVQSLTSRHGTKHHNRVFTNTMKLHKIDMDTIVIALEPKERGVRRIIGSILGAASR